VGVSNITRTPAPSKELNLTPKLPNLQNSQTGTPPPPAPLSPTGFPSLGTSTFPPLSLSGPEKVLEGFEREMLDRVRGKVEKSREAVEKLHGPKVLTRENVTRGSL
jgi:hypothetical protein